MVRMWQGDIVTGDDYALEFKSAAGKKVVQVLEVTSSYPIGRNTQHVSMSGLPTETRDLPLEREEAEEMVQNYLSDLHTESQKLVVERLCAG